MVPFIAMNKSDIMVDAMCQFTKELQKYEVLVKFFIRYEENFNSISVSVRKGSNLIMRLYSKEHLTCMKSLSLSDTIKSEVREMVQLLTGVSKDEVS